MITHQPKILEAGYKRLIKKIVDEGYTLKELIQINNRRYYIVLGVINETQKQKNFLITYKRELFHNFGVMFIDENCPEEGDTINVEELKKAKRFNVEDIYTVLAEGMVYRINIDDFLKKSFKWKNSEGKEVRSASIKEYKEVFNLNE